VNAIETYINIETLILERRILKIIGESTEDVDIKLINAIKE
jgi:hypothetical protein